MVRRGRAVVKKSSSKWKEVWVDSDSEEISPPSSEENKKGNRCAYLEPSETTR